MIRMSVLFASALACWFVCPGSHARAEDVTWSYSWTGTSEVLNSNGGGVKLLLGSGTYNNNQNGVTAALLQAFGPAGNIVNGQYTLSVHIQDNATKDFTDLTFHGVLNGPTNLGLQNTFSIRSPRRAWSGPTTSGWSSACTLRPGRPAPACRVCWPRTWW